jgi:rhomboid protease GluP
MHLLFNMYFLYLVGPLIEELYGTTRFLVIYGLTAAAGSAASFAVGGPAPSVGASGAIFGLCGVLVAVSAIHRPVLDRRGRAIMSQIGVLVLINLAIGFGLGALVGANIDNAAHVGGLLAGIWLGLALRPIRSTLSSFWQRPVAPGGVIAQSSASARGSVENAMRLLAVGALAAVIVAAVLLGPV